MLTEKSVSILERVKQRVRELHSADCTRQLILENLNKLYCYGRELEDENSVQVRDAALILLRGFESLTIGTLMEDRLYLARYEMQGSKDDLIAVYRKFIDSLEDESAQTA